MNVLIGFSKSELKNSVVPSIKKERILTDMHNRFKLHGLCVTKILWNLFYMQYDKL